MKKTLLSLILCTVCLGLWAQKSFDLPRFHALSNETAADLVIQMGASQSVRAEGPAQAIDRLRLRVKNGSLEIKSEKPGRHDEIGRVTIRITMTDLNALATSGSGDVLLRGDFDLDGLSIANSGSGDYQTNGQIHCPKLSLSNNGSGDIALKGSAGEVSAVNSGSGDLNLRQFQGGKVSVVNSGSGDVAVFCEKRLSLVNNGSGDVIIYGTPTQKNVVSQGSGDVRFASANN
ncbi:MAG: DUF2807 domain-containing protein [Bacteroidetes bacterium]|nr:MAG: DUF2807 domain-containing protein [Bacteroidota bacterium]